MGCGGSGTAPAARRYLRADWQGSIVSVIDNGGNPIAINSYDGVACLSAIGITEEHRQPAISPLRHMMRDAGDDDPGMTISASRGIVMRQHRRLACALWYTVPGIPGISEFTERDGDSKPWRSTGARSRGRHLRPLSRV